MHEKIYRFFIIDTTFLLFPVLCFHLKHKNQFKAHVIQLKNKLHQPHLSLCNFKKNVYRVLSKFTVGACIILNHIDKSALMITTSHIHIMLHNEKVWNSGKPGKTFHRIKGIYPSFNIGLVLPIW